MIYTTKDICDLQIASNCGNFFPKSNNCDYKVTLLTSGRRFKVFIGMRLNSRKILVIYIHDRIQNSNHNNICFESKSGIFLAFTHEIIYCRENFHSTRALIGYVKGNFQRHFPGYLLAEEIIFVK